MAIFAPDLIYHQADGKTINLQRLTKDVARQFRSQGDADWTFTLHDQVHEGGVVVETVAQSGWFAATAFGLLHRVWLLERQGRYVWKLHDGRWCIGEVTILREKVTPAGFQFGLRPRPPFAA
jgi:hypothetical protein